MRRCCRPILWPAALLASICSLMHQHVLSLPACPASRWRQLGSCALPTGAAGAGGRTCWPSSSNSCDERKHGLLRLRGGSRKAAKRDDGKETKKPPTPDQSRTLSPYDTLTHSRAANVDDVQNCTAGAGAEEEDGERRDSGAGDKNAPATSAAEVLDLCGGGTLLSGASFARARLRADECFRRVIQQALSLAAPPCGLQGYWEWRVRNYWSVPSSLALDLALCVAFFSAPCARTAEERRELRARRM